MRRLDPGDPGFALSCSMKIYRSDHYDMWHNVPSDHEVVN